ncbi:peptidoglycan-binding domain-containing protein [Streptomyces brasiliensis]|uniref:peptidoglycan-binding domain-containing protein n=1 Tax=Streptomyces brasiliensis TaxID=1954 RepID=UPI001671151E|nr:peptidoglycan-binding domain-containing protein [Streptomyces brasiliensis]
MTNETSGTGGAGAQGNHCPQCGTPRAADNTPACACGREASDALRDVRTAEAAAAEDFDPLRIRPYVELEPFAEGGEADTGGATEPERAAEATMALRAVPAVPPVATTASEPATTDLSLFERGEDGPEPGAGTARPPRRRSRRVMLLSVTGAAVATVAAAGFASGLLSYDTPTRNGAAPQDLRQSVPDATTTDTASVPVPESTAAQAEPESPSASPATNPSPSLTPSATRSTTPPSATASRSVQPTQTATLTSSADAEQPAAAPVLRRGDSGAEVTELQLRLRQLSLFYGKANGKFDNRTENAVRTYQSTRGIGGDESGVYGAATRASLESETTQP